MSIWYRAQRDIVRAIRCPWCGAAPGQECRAEHFGNWTFPHGYRVEAARRIEFERYGAHVVAWAEIDVGERPGLCQARRARGSGHRCVLRTGHAGQHQNDRGDVRWGRA